MKYVVKINGGLWCDDNDKNIFDIEGVKKLFKDNGVEKFKFDDEDFGIDEYNIDEGIDKLINSFEDIECYNEELFEMGDDFCELRICEVS